MLDELDLSGVTNPEARRILGLLLNVIEAQAAEIALLRAENQRLRDENRRLKGEQGAPTILPAKRAAADHASERERRTGRSGRPAARKDKGKRSLIHIDRTEEREVDPALLPPDAERKGYAEVVVQDVALRTDTVLFRCARWYAASTRRSYQAPLPEDYVGRGHYGPGLKALALQLYYQGQMSEPKILEMQQTVTADPRRTPTLRCPRCARDVDPADLSVQSRGELRLLDPHSARYDRQPFPEREGVALCDDCGRQLDAIAQEMDTQRRRLTRLWPRPTSPRGRLLDDQRLSRTFEAIRDTAIEDVLGWAVWHDRRGQDAYLVVYETGEWAIDPVPRGQVYDDVDDRGYLALPIPVAPAAAAGEATDNEDAGDTRAGSTLRELDAAALYRQRAPSDAAHEPLEMDLATRFYQMLYSQDANAAEGRGVSA